MLTGLNVNMFSECDLCLLNRLINSDFVGARLFALSVKNQGFMTTRQRDALSNMNNSLRPWSSKAQKNSKYDGIDHDDLASGLDGH